MSKLDVQDLSTVDLADQSVWDDGPPYELFKQMQREDPIHFSAQNSAPDERVIGTFLGMPPEDDEQLSCTGPTFSPRSRIVRSR
jgi:hypothetical protein